GMIGPALIFLAFNGSDPVNAHGWGIPMATDIAFALGILAMLGNRVPPSLKIFLAALAIADDMGAVLVIALFYTSELSLIMLAAGGVFFVLLLISNRFNIRSTAVYTLLGIGLWFCFLKSGIHATIAGVLLATTIPVASGTEKKKKDHPHHDEHSPLHRFEHALQPYVAFLIMPIFAVANAGVKIEGSITDALFSPLGNGILFGLIAGKQIGIVSFVWIAVKLKLAELPKSVTWGMIYGTSWLCAIGFTMALFIAGLAFTSNEPLVISKIAVLSASIAAGVGGFIILRSMTSMQKH
ncbi:MAG: Na+/H+ antiporter NhaA, partial [Bacteroidota bacterium]